MKSIITILIVVLFSLYRTSAEAQNILNGGFEGWDTVYFPINPTNWMNVIATTPCTPTLSPTERTSDGYMGNWATLLESKECTDDQGNPRITAGFLFTGTIGSNFPNDWAHSISSYPSEFEFYYKFHPQGGDSAAVFVHLFSQGSNSQDIDTIATGYTFINEETTVYKKLTVPLNYFSSKQPDFIHIIFSTSKKLLDRNRLIGKPNEDAFAGTKLWIDDLSLQGNSTGFMDSQPSLAKHVSIMPNPVTDDFKVQSEEVITGVEVYDCLGKKVKKFPSNLGVYSVSELNTAVYFIRVYTPSNTYTLRFKKN